jgi:hypothetical protein
MMMWPRKQKPGRKRDSPGFSMVAGEDLNLRTEALSSMGVPLPSQSPTTAGGYERRLAA